MENNGRIPRDWEKIPTNVSEANSDFDKWKEEWMRNSIGPPFPDRRPSFPDRRDPYLANTEDVLAGYLQRELSNNTHPHLHDEPGIREEDDTTRSSEKANEDGNLKQPEQKICFPAFARLIA
ncbi:hypothetical protein TIFTF001_033783 [Ficus carica]|uniref:Uncharacterized protein n=1 Tax=Ficus carica TaxID=3494 RepID=A0AA88J9N3_FICCA|nr:hypothetical protein TIFTF001_033783 [Ficus carica]